MLLFEYEASLIYISPEEKEKGCYEFYKAEHNKTQYKDDCIRKQITMFSS